MNAYYQQNNRIHSNNDIFEAYFMEGAVRTGAFKKMLDQLLSVLATVLTFLASAPVVRFFRIGGTALSLVGLVGVIGAMECGTLGIGAGLLIGLALIGVEILCLRHH